MKSDKFDAASGPQGTRPVGEDLVGRRRSRRASVVVLDPSPLSLLALAGVLDSRGYQCTCARTPEAGVAALAMGSRQDLLVCDVGDDATMALETLQRMRNCRAKDPLPAVFLADACWAGLEQKVEAMATPTRCLFKPIDPHALIAVVDQILWMPSLVEGHRRRGTRPSRPGWVTL